MDQPELPGIKVIFIAPLSATGVQFINEARIVDVELMRANADDGALLKGTLPLAETNPISVSGQTLAYRISYAYGQSRMCIGLL